MATVITKIEEVRKINELIEESLHDVQKIFFAVKGRKYLTIMAQSANLMGRYVVYKFNTTTCKAPIIMQDGSYDNVLQEFLKVAKINYADLMVAEGRASRAKIRDEIYYLDTRDSEVLEVFKKNDCIYTVERRKKYNDFILRCYIYYSCSGLYECLYSDYCNRLIEAVDLFKKSIR